MITVEYNGNPDLPAERNHITRYGRTVMRRKFKTFEEAVMFWLECSFYSGAITSLDKLFSKNKSRDAKAIKELISSDREAVILDEQVDVEL